MDALFSWIPLLGHLRSYSWEQFKADLKASLNVSLLDFPQGMAYAMIAGLPVQFGIYSSAIGSILGPVFASSRYLMLGPTNASAVLLFSALMAFEVSPEQKLAMIPLLLLMVGGFLVFGTMIQAHTILQFVSRSVVTGYITAAALLIIVKQLKYILSVETEGTVTFFESLVAVVRHLPEAQSEPLVLAVITMGLYPLTRRTIRFLPAVAVTLVLVSLVNWLLQETVYASPCLDPLPMGTWPLSVPEFRMTWLYDLASPAVAIAFLSLLESSSIAKTLAARAGENVNIRQQMISMGIANFGNAFGSGMPVSGSLTRSALNYQSGARTPVASMVSGSLLVAGVLLLGPMIGHIPKSALAALVVMVGLSLINLETIRVVVGTTRSDMVTFFTTFIGGLIFPLDLAIYMGVGVSLLFFLKNVARPEIVEYAFDREGRLGEIPEPEKEKRPAISIIHIEGDLFFGAADLFLEEMRRLVARPEVQVIILRLRNARNMDASAALAFMEMVRFAREKKRHVLISGVHPKVEQILESSGVLAFLGEEHVFRSTPQNLTLSTRNALKKAQEFLGRPDADIVLLAPAKEGSG